MIRFDGIKQGDTIGVIALSSPTEECRLIAGTKFLESLGFKVRIALNPSRYYGTKTHLFSSDTPSTRAGALHDLFLDKSVKAVISARGAYGAMELLPLLDFKRIGNNPKPLIGFSDTTALLLAISQHAKFPTIHGPSIESAFAKAESDEQARQSAEATIRLLRGEEVNPFRSKTFRRVCGQSKDARGILVGGNLTLLCHLMGTPWEASMKDSILFIEDVGEKPYRIHRMLLQLKLAGKFRALKGVLVGSFRDCSSENGPSLDDVLEDIFGDTNIPVLAGASFGHDPLNFPVPIGVKAKLFEDKLEILESTVVQ